MKVKLACSRAALGLSLLAGAWALNAQAAVGQEAGEAHAEAGGAAEAPGHSAAQDPGHPADAAHAQDSAHGGEASAEHGEHDPYDLSELNATPGSTIRQVSLKDMLSESVVDPLADPAEWRFDMALFTVLVFLVLFGALGKFAWKPIVQGLDQREASIAAMIDEARNSQEVAAQKLQEYEARLAKATEEAQAIIVDAKNDAAASAEKILADAEAAANKQRERAIADIGAAKTVALTEIAERSVDAALGLAGNIVGQHLQRDGHEQLIRDALDRFPARN